MWRYPSAPLLQNEGIVRHRGKIEAVIHNAACAVELQAEPGSLAAYFWQYEINPTMAAPAQTASTSPESVALSKDLKKRGSSTAHGAEDGCSGP